MKVRVGERVHAGSAVQIMEQFRDLTFTTDDYPDVESYIRQMRLDYIRSTGVNFDVPDGDTETRARAMIAMLEKEIALEILDNA